MCVCVEAVSSLALPFIPRMNFIHRNAFAEPPVSCLKSHVGSSMEIQKPAAFQLSRAGLCFYCSVTHRVCVFSSRKQSVTVSEVVKQ